MKLWTPIFFFVFLFLAYSVLYAQQFDSTKEFPNLFLPEVYRNQPLHLVPKSAIENSQRLLEAALRSIFQRLSVPIVPEGESEVKVISYYPYLYEKLSKIDPQVKIYPSGGIVRSALSYIYQQIYDSEGQDAEMVLTAIAHDLKPIPGYHIRGVGSDFDSLLISSKFPEIEQRILQMTNSAEAHFEMRESNSAAKRIFFSVGDVKEYYAQTERSTQQGGSAIDFLAFDPQTGKFVEPPNQPGIVEGLILGHNRYVSPQRDRRPENAQKQTIRGIRPLLELPFLIYDSESETILRGELESLKKELQTGQLDRKVIDQFQKMIRNARFSGAHNRIYRAKLGSLDALVFDVFSLISQKLGQPAVPEFVDHFSIENRDSQKSELRGIRPETLLSMERFIAEYTDHGVVYHGTPEFFKALAIMRGGLFVSKHGQGLSNYGRGAYSSMSIATAQGRAGQRGLILELTVKRTPKINILAWNDQTKEDPVIQGLIQKHGGNLDPIFEILTRNHGIDIIVNNHVLIQNTAALDLSFSLEMILKSLWHGVNNSELDMMGRVLTYLEFEKYRQYALNLGIDVTDQVDLKELTQNLNEALLSSDHKIRLRAAWALGEVGFEDAEITRRLTRLLTDDRGCIERLPLYNGSYTNYGLTVRLAALQALQKQNLIPDSQVLLEVLRSSDETEASKLLAIWWAAHLKIEQAIPELKEALLSPNYKIRLRAAWALGEVGFEDAEITRRLTRLLTDDCWCIESLPLYNGSYTDYGLTVRLAAQQALQKQNLIPDSQVLLEVLRSSDETEASKLLAIWWVAHLKIEQAIPELKEALLSSNYKIRLRAAWALGEVGFEDAEITQRLTRLLTDDCWCSESLPQYNGSYTNYALTVRLAAQQALQKQNLRDAQNSHETSLVQAADSANKRLSQIPAALDFDSAVDKILEKYSCERKGVSLNEMRAYFRDQFPEEYKRAIDTETLSRRLVEEMARTQFHWDRIHILRIVKGCMREAYHTAER